MEASLTCAHLLSSAQTEQYKTSALIPFLPLRFFSLEPVYSLFTTEVTQKTCLSGGGWRELCACRGRVSIIMLNTLMCHHQPESVSDIYGGETNRVHHCCVVYLTGNGVADGTGKVKGSCEI